MTAEELRAALAAELAPLAAKVTALEARVAASPAPVVEAPPGERAAPATSPAPAAVVESAEVTSLRARLALAEQRNVDGFAGRRGRAPVGHMDESRAQSEIEAMAEGATQAAPGLAAVCRAKGFGERRAVSHYGSPMQEIANMRGSIEGDLRAVLNAAVEDGLIREPEDTMGSWA